MFSKCNYCFVTAYVADFHAEGAEVGVDCTVPEIVGFATVDGDSAVAFDFDFRIAVPWGVLLGCGTVERNHFDCFKTFGA